MTADKIERSPRGQFLPGVGPGQPGPGRPPGSLAFRTVADALAKRTGTSVAGMTEEVLEVVLEQAKDGCRLSQKLWLERACPAEKGPMLAVAIDARTVGPPMPTGVDLTIYAEKLLEVTRKQGLLPDHDDDVEGLLE